MDWNAFEAAWHEQGCRALATLATAHPDERVYAAAFHLFYGDGVQILPPALAANAESAVDDADGCSTRFAAPEWRWPVLDAATEAMRPWYHRLTDEFLAAARTDAEQLTAMAALEAAHDTAMAAVCRAITTSVRQDGVHPLLPPDFVVLVLEPQRDDQAGLLRASVDPHILATVPALTDFLAEIE
ncbi:MULTISPECIES: hypothetical protein [Catenuloplanes]|uniref:DUF4303 domain-containing protein n=1 Tax=Catenuloplanes niger TaxID=587534 RepID=A0AAE4CXK8_9ACTN|nr:hypothetical protein [Catenuloplanes niger]MDR7327597.1 hypothetical protein [Catenuloplanes niger]